MVNPKSKNTLPKKILFIVTVAAGIGIFMPVMAAITDGSLSPDFGGIYTYNGGYADGIKAVTKDSSGRILAAGYVNNGTMNKIAVWRFNTNGTPDRTFGTGGLAMPNFANATQAYDVVVNQGTGKIYVSGTMDSTHKLMVVWAFNADGTPDITFAGTGFIVFAGNPSMDYFGRSIALDGGGNICTAGNVDAAGISNLLIWRCSQAGADLGYTAKMNIAGGNLVNIGYDIVINPSNIMFVTGASTNVSGNLDMYVFAMDIGGNPYTAFNGTGVAVLNGTAGGNGDDAGYGITLDASGRVLVAGSSTNSGGNNDMVLWRFTAAGALDTTFNSTGYSVKDGIAGGGADDYGYSARLDGSGNILVSGASMNSGANLDAFVMRYASSGSLDTTFNNTGIYVSDGAAGGNLDDSANSVIVDNGGNIVLGGKSYNGTDDDAVSWRLNSDGTLPGYNLFTGPSGSDQNQIANCVIRDASGNLYFGGQVWNNANGWDHIIWKARPNGSVIWRYTVSWAGTGAIRGMCFDQTGKIVGVGESSGDMLIVRLNTDGTYDTTFNGTGFATHAGLGMGSDVGYAVTKTNDGKIAVAGSSYNGANDFMAVWSYNSADGSLNTGFNGSGFFTHHNAGGGNGNDRAFGIAALNFNTNLIVTGESYGAAGTYKMAVWKLYGSGGGVLDSFFTHDGIPGKGNGSGRAIVQVPGANRMIIAGRSMNSSSLYDVTLWAVDQATMALDTAFGLAGLASYNNAAENLNDGANSLVLDPWNNILAAGYTGTAAQGDNMLVCKFSAYGAIDASFGSGGAVTHDNAAGGNGPDTANGIVLDAAANRIYTAGYSRYDSTYYDAAVWKHVEYVNQPTPTFTNTFTITDTPTPQCIINDAGFGGSGRVTHNGASGSNSNDYAYDTVPYPGNRILAAGYSNNGTYSYPIVWRYNSNGTLDTTFNGTGYRNLGLFGSGSAWLNAVAVNPNGTIFAVGSAYNNTTGNYDMFFTKLFSDGTTAFNVLNNAAAGINGNDGAYGITLDPQGRILITGYSTNPGGNTDMVIWRYLPDGTLDTKFNSTGIVVHNNAAGGNGADSGSAIAVAANGEIFVTGASVNASGNNDVVAWNYTSTGALDTTFNGTGYRVFNNLAGGNGDDIGYSLCLESGTDSAIYITGYSDGDPSATTNYMMFLLKLNSTGGVYPAFNGGYVLYNSTYSVYGMKVLERGSGQNGIVVVGHFWDGGGAMEDAAVWRYNYLTGSLDTTFNGTGLLKLNVSRGDYGYGAALDGNGNLIVAGAAEINYCGIFSPCYNYDMALWKINDVCAPTPTITPTMTPACGALDTSFYDTGYRVFTNPNDNYSKDVAVDASGYIYSVGTYNPGSVFMTVYRYRSDGASVQPYGNNGWMFNEFTFAASYASACVVDSSGRLVVAGYILNGGVYYMTVWRLTAAGNPDGTFIGGGRYIGPANSYAYGICLDASGKILVAGSMSGTQTVWRLLATGAPDTGTFNPPNGYYTTGAGAQANAVAVDGSGNVFFTGINGSGVMNVYKLKNAGGILASSTYNGNASGGNAIAVDGGGNILIGGKYKNGSNFDFTLWRYKNSLALDTTFNMTGRKNIDNLANGNGDDVCNDIAIDASGRIVAAGYSYATTGNLDMAVVRVLGSGALDTSFNSTGIFTHAGAAGGNGDEAGNGIFLQADNKIVVSGYGAGLTTGQDPVVWRLKDECGAFYTPTVTPTLNVNPPCFTLKWGKAGTGNAQFNGPFAAAVDSSGNVDVVDYGNNRIQKFDGAGNYMTQWGGSGSGNGQFLSPYGIAADSSGNIYVADYGNHRIQKFDSAGNYLTQFSLAYAPYGVAIDNSGNIYVSDQINNRVQKLDNTGAYITQWAVTVPFGIAADNAGNIYVTSVSTNTIQKFSDTGIYLSQWGGPGSGNGLFSNPMGIAIDSSLSVYIIDYGNRRVQKFDNAGSYITQWGALGSGDGQFNNPYGVAVDNSGNIYVADYGNSRIQKFGACPPTPTPTRTCTFTATITATVTVTFTATITPTFTITPTDTITPTGTITPTITNTPCYLDLTGTTTLTAGTYSYCSVDIHPGGILYLQGQVIINVDSDFTLENGGQVIGDGGGNAVSLYAGNGAYSSGTSGCWNGLGGGGGGGHAYNGGAGGAGYRGSKPFGGCIYWGGLVSGGSGGTGFDVFFNPGLPGDAGGKTGGLGTGGAGGAAFLLNAPAGNVVLNGTISVKGQTKAVNSGDPYGGGGGAGGTIYVQASSISGNGTLNVTGGSGATGYDYTNGRGSKGFGGSGGGSGGIINLCNTSSYTFIGSFLYAGGGGSGAGGGGGEAAGSTGREGMVYICSGALFTPTATPTSTVTQTSTPVDGPAPCYLSQWGSLGSGNGQFNYDRGIAITASGTVYVTDSNNYRVEKFDSSGNYVTQWGGNGSGNGQFSSIFGVATDSAGNVYVSDSNRVQKFDADGNYLLQWGGAGTGNGQFNWAYGIAVDASNYVYVADGSNNRVQKFDSNGNYITQWGTTGTGNGQFTYPYGVAVNGAGEVYVVEYGNARVQKFTSSGGYITQWGSGGSGTALFNGPIGVAVDGAGAVYIADTGNHRIQKFDSNGIYLTKWGTVGTGDGQLNNPYSVAVDNGGVIFVADTYSHRVQKFGACPPTPTCTWTISSTLTPTLTWTLTGTDTVTPTYTWTLSSTLTPTLTWTLSSTLTPTPTWTPTSTNTATFTYTGTPTGTPTNTQSSSPSATPTRTGTPTGTPTNTQSSSPSATPTRTGTPTGTPTNTQSSSPSYTPTRTGTPTGTPTNTQSSSPSATPTRTGTPTGTDTNSPTGTNTATCSITLTPANTPTIDINPPCFITKWGSAGAGDGQFNQPYGTARDSGGNIYAVDQMNHRVQKFTSAGIYEAQWGSNGSGNGQFKFPSGIAIDAGDNVYIADYFNHRIQKFTPAGVYITQWGSNGSGDGQFQFPQGIGIDNSGNIYVADSQNNRVQKFTSTGTFITKWGALGSGDGQMNHPSGIAIDAAGNVFVVDFSNARVQVFGAGGSFITKWGASGAGDGQFNGPFGIVLSGGAVYVSDTGNNRLQKFLPDGSFITKWGGFGSGDGQFNSPRGLAVDDSGNIYAADQNNNRIQKFGVCPPTPSFTPTYTDTETYTVTSTPTLTWTLSSTATPTLTWTLTGTNTPSPANTPTVTVTFPCVAGTFGQTGIIGAAGIGTDRLASRFTLSKSVYVNAINVYLYPQSTCPGSGTGPVKVGIYSDFAGAPADLIVSDAWTAFSQGSWNKFPVTSTYLPAGTYWIAFVGNGGGWRCMGQGTLSGGLTALGTGGDLAAAFGAVSSTWPVEMSLYADYCEAPTATYTETPTFTPTPTCTWTLSSTLTPTLTWTLSGTSTDSPTITLTPTNTPTIDPNPPCYISQWSTGGTNFGIDTDSSGNVFVTGYDSGIVQKYSSTGAFITQWGGFNYPHGLAVDDGGNVYVADNFNHRIQKFDNSGAYLTQWGGFGSGDGQLKNPNGVAIDNNGDVLVVDYNNNRVQKFTNTGAYISQFGSAGNGNGQFNLPRWVDVDAGGNIYVTDAGNNRVEKFDSSGAYLSQWGSAGTGNGQFSFPLGIFIDRSSGTVYVLDAGNNRIQKFDAAGTYLSQWGGTGSGNGQFNYPRGITMDNSGNIYVADNDNHRVQKFGACPPTPTFTPTYTVTETATPTLTWTLSSTLTPTLTWTLSSTLTPTLTWTLTGTATATPTLTWTLSSTLTPTLTWTLTGTDSATPTLTWTLSSTLTPTLTWTMTVSNTVTLTVSPTNTVVTYDLTLTILGGGSGNVLVMPLNVTCTGGTCVYTVSSGTSLTFYESPGGDSVFSGWSGPCMGMQDTCWTFMDQNKPQWAAFVLKTATPTLTGTDTSTPTLTWTLSSTLTPSETASMTPTFTNTPSPTAPAPPSNTFTNTLTGTATASPTITLTLITGGTPTSTPTIDFNMPCYLSKWGSAGSGNGQFSNPAGIAIGGSGNIYIADRYNNRIQKFDSAGAYVTQWGSSGGNSGQFSSPNGIALDSGENVYVVDTYNYRIQKFNSAGIYITQWGSSGSGDGQFSGAAGIAADNNGYVYVADTYNNRIQKFDSTGAYITQWGSPGSGDGQFSGPNGVAVDSSGNVYVTEGWNNRIQKFDNTGVYITKWGNAGSGSGQFINPSGVAIDGGGCVYVVDQGNHRMQKFTSAGTFIAKWGSSGASNGQFGNSGFNDGPLGAAIDNSGNLYVADTQNNRIQKFGACPQTADPSIPCSVLRWGSAGTGDGQFNYPYGLTLDGSGNVLVVDLNNNRVEKFTSSGAFITKWGGVWGTGPGQFEDPTGVTVDNSGNVYVLDANNRRIEKFDSSGAYLMEFANGQLYWPNALAADGSGNIYVADTNNNRIMKYTSAGAYVSEWGGLPYGGADGQFYYPYGITVDNSGYVYVADTSNNRIQKFSDTGLFIAKWGSYGNGDGQFSAPSGITADNIGNVYVSDRGNNRVQKFTSAGVFVKKWETTGNNDGQFNAINGIAVDSSGAVYVADSGNNRIQKFSDCPPTLTITPTGTETATPTLTWTLSSTLTPTLTCTPTSSASGTPADTATPTLTWTLSSTLTPTLTCTPTSSASGTPTDTATPTLTWTLSSTLTPTLTWTLTGTPVNTATGTPAITTTNTPVNTAIDTPANTETNTPVNTATNTPVDTVTITPVNTATDTPVNTATDTPINTATSTPVNTVTFTPEDTATDTATAGPAYTATDTPVVTATVTGSDTETPSVTETGTDIITPSVTETITGTMTETPADTATETPVDTDTPTPADSPTSTVTVTITITSNPTFTPTLTPTIAPTVQPDQAVVYPCPAANAITVSIKNMMSGDRVVLTVYTSAFRKVLRQECAAIVSNKYTADVSKLANGTYALVIEIYGGSNRVYRGVKPITVIK